MYLLSSPQILGALHNPPSVQPRGDFDFVRPPPLIFSATPCLRGEAIPYVGITGPAINPPSSVNACPVINEARSEHIHSTASAISIGLPKRPIGCSPTIYFSTCGSPNSRSPIGVAITAGHTALIRIPLRAVSSAADFVSPSTPCLLEE